MSGYDPLLGTILADDFKIIKLVGFGGYARVYLAEQLSVGRRKVAVKILHSMHVEQVGKSALEALKREAAYLAMLRSPCFPGILRTGITDAGLPYFVMEFIVGRNLETIIREEGKLPLNRVVSILKDVCEGVSEMHGRDILHRDIKPGNIVIEKLVNGAEKAYLIDLGSAKPTYEGENVSVRSGVIPSVSPPYIAPETARTGRASEASDIYSIGALAYEMICGIKAIHIRDGAPEAYMEYLLSTNPIPTFKIASIQPDIPEAVETVIMKALARNPSERYGSVSEFISALLESVRVSIRNGDRRILQQQNPDGKRLESATKPDSLNAFRKIKRLLHFGKE